MSTRGVRAATDDCLPTFELMEPRLLLSGGAAAEFAVGQSLAEGIVALHEQLQQDEDPVIRRPVVELVASVAELRAGNPQADASTLSNNYIYKVTPDGDIKVRIMFESDRTDMLPSLTSLGFRAGSFHQSLVPAWRGGTTGWVSYKNIDAIAAIPGVLEVSLPQPPITQQEGYYDTAGNQILHADNVRSLLSLSGEGVKVGVISDGAAYWDVINDWGDLPETITIDEEREGEGIEGCAMMEIIYDMAPGVEFYFSGPADSLEMLDSIEWLVEQECDIIVDDISFLEEPYFQDGDVAQAALDAIDGMTIGQTTYDPVVYVTCAGNHATSTGNHAKTHYQAQYYDDGYGAHLFDEGLELLKFELSDGATVAGWLQWSDEWGESDNNFDISIMRETAPDYWQTVESSTDPQNGHGYDPYEWLYYQNTYGDHANYAWIISGAWDVERELELFIKVYDGSLEWDDPGLLDAGDSVFGHAAADGVIAVGAIDARDPGNDDIEPFSCQGPSTIFTSFDDHDQTYTARDSLDVAGIDYVTTVAYSPYLFAGTSAAAPHIAAIAALLLEADSTLDPADIVDLINDNAEDLGATGYDDVFGSGRADALAIFSATPDEPDLTAGSDTGATGVHDSDDLTYLDNSAAGKELVFTVDGTISGATVKLYAGETLIGSATATGASTNVTTNGTVVLTDDEHVITATQTETGKVESAHSDGLTITVDTEAPTVEAFNRFYDEDDWELAPTILDWITITFSEDVYDTLSGGSLTLYNLSQEEVVTLSPEVSYGYHTATWDFGELELYDPADDDYAGWYLVTISTTLTDIAGNALEIAYEYGEEDPENKMLIPFRGDANLDGTVDGDDFGVLQGNWQKAGTWLQADFDYTGFVDAFDYAALQGNWQECLSR